MKKASKKMEHLDGECKRINRNVPELKKKKVNIRRRGIYL